MRFSLGRLLDRAIAPFAPTVALRRGAARTRFDALQRLVDRQQKELSVYDGAKRDRRTKNWNPRRGSADYANLSDYDTLLVRGRSMMRDNWAAQSIIGAYGRNVVGRGIVPNATAKKGKTELRKFNEAIDTLFMRWGSKKKHCDVAKKQTFWQKQKMAVEEMVGVGEHFIVWSYEPNPNAVGLRLQSYEPEQLDIVKLQNPETGNFIRRGIEVDRLGAPVAYWFYERPLNDWFPFLPAGVNGSIWTESTRIPADQVLHLHCQRRTRESHGVTWLAPVLNKLHGMYVADDSTLTGMQIEAMIALIINLEDPRSANGNPPETLPPRNDQVAGPDGVPLGSPTPDYISRDGGPQSAFEPGMIFTGKEGEKVTAFQKQGPPNSYEPFMKTTLRAAGAGTGLSYDVVARDYDGGNYSSKRQGMLEDRRSYAPVQDLVIDDVVSEVYELFVAFAILEDAIAGGKRWNLGVDLNDFLENKETYLDAEYLTDGFSWVDPAKEAAAASIALDKRLTTRKKIIGQQGDNWRRVFAQIAAEQAEADAVGITLPDVEPTAPKTAGDAPPTPQNDGQDDEPAPKPPPGKKGGDEEEGDQSSLSDRLVERVLLSAVSD